MNATLGLWAGLGAWRSARWAWRPTLAYGVTTSAMVLALEPILQLGTAARGGLRAGAAIVLGLSAMLAWYLHRALARER